MSPDAASTPLRLGLLGSRPDPVAQLLEDLHGHDNMRFVQLTDPLADAPDLDEIVVLSQAHALAHLNALMETGLPCRILVRRRGAAADEASWQTGMDWLAAVLRRADWPQARLVALTPAAAEELAELFDQPVTPIGALRRIPGDRPTVPIPRAAEAIRFSSELVDGEQENRRAQLEIYNWTRLRRLAHLTPADPGDVDMADLTEFANGIAVGPDAGLPASTAHRQACILVVVPNGIGLGHITRMMAIATELKNQGGARVVFWSFSRAAEILQAAGFEVILRQNAMHLAAHPPDWRLWETLEFASAIRHFRPTAIIYDGGTFDMFMIDAMRSPGCGKCGVVWVRRGMLHRDADAQLLEAEQYCDIVLEPGDLAVEMDMGPTRMRRAHFRGFSRRVLAPPVVLKPYLPSYDRKAARKRLGLGWGRHCLVSLGGAFGNWDTLRRQIIDFAGQNRVKLIWAQSPLAGASGEDLGDTIVRQFYPLSRYLSAFDGIITAAGYNSYHELMLGYDRPVLFAPTNNVRLDDQVARATFAGQQNWASVVYSDRPEDQSGVVRGFMEQVRRGERISTRPEPVQGAQVMAREILSVCKKYM